MDNEYKKYVSYVSEVYVCPNPDCRKITITNSLYMSKYSELKGYTPDTSLLLNHQKFQPRTNHMIVPDYVPKAIKSDYEEACAVLSDSPKASAALCRRCLQGMIRDFWGVVKSRLIDEIMELKSKVDTETWESIDSVRTIGNIGAHMEKDVNLIIDVESDEAELLIQLIEMLIRDWYIQREQRKIAALKIKKVAAEKEAKKKAV
jgi:hypothetical protein